MSSTTARAISGTRSIKTHFLLSASLTAITVFGAMPDAQAQLIARRGVTTASPTAPRPSVPAALRNERMTAALGRQTGAAERAASIRTMVTQARAASAAAVRTIPTDGLGFGDKAGGLVPIAPIRNLLALKAQEASLRAQGLTTQADAIAAQFASASAATLTADRDATGLATWQGASLPVETTANGETTVTITQSQERAILSWNQFDIGANTSLNFSQKSGGVAQPGWIALNRVVGSTAPSTILGNLTADGTVVVINANGTIFGNGAQVKTHSLLVSTLEIGNFAKGQGGDSFTGLTLQERNLNFAQNGLLTSATTINATQIAPMLTSAQVDGNTYNIGQISDLNTALGKAVAGNVEIDRGATITSGKGGFVILTAPNVVNDGAITATEGQVSLQAGRAISYALSTGAASSVDPNVRGIVVRSAFGANGAVTNSGLIDSARGYISLGAGLDGSVTNSGLLASSTSVSRNGKISLTAGAVTLSGATTQANASGIVITADDSTGETVPVGSVDFKTSQVEIGGIYIPTSSIEDYTGLFGPASVNIGQNAMILAPSATVDIGGRSGVAFDPFDFTDIGHTASSGSITMGAGALIDVGGIKDLELAASRNSVFIETLKRNELRDTPNYREPASDTNTGFTLNGSSFYIDPRVSGTRTDGVRWVGSPLIDGSGAVSQVAVGAAELMTRGGNVTMAVAPVQQAVTTGLVVPRIVIDADADIDISGGWVRYLEGTVTTSRLLSASGEIIDVANADPNDIFGAVGTGFTETQFKFGVERTYSSPLLTGSRIEPTYTEGRDAGSFILSASTATLDGAVFGDTFAGSRQIARASFGTDTSSIAGDPRVLQSDREDMPSGGYLKLGSFSGDKGTALGGDIIVYDGTGAKPTANAGQFLLNDAMLSAAQLSALTLQTSGAVNLLAGSDLTLAPGGALTIDAGRTINFDGTVTAHGGTISARTYELVGANSGSAFTAADDLATRYARGTTLPALFDINVTGTLDTSGLWTNDFGIEATEATGKAFVDGGSITLTVAPRVLALLGEADGSVRYAADLSGSIRIARSGLLNVSSDGYVSASGALDLTARGGDIALVNETSYASLSKTDIATEDSVSEANTQINGANQSVTFTPIEDARDGFNRDGVTYALMPETVRAEVAFDTASLTGLSFGGGGTFTLVAPDISFGSNASGARGPNIGLDFLSRTGFGTLDLSAWNSRFVDNVFSNGIVGKSAFLNTSRFVIGAGETLDLTQTLRPFLLDNAQTANLIALATGSDVDTVLTTSVRDPWDAKAAHLKLGGLIELDVMAGGAITGAAQASITTPKLYNAGTIRIHGGTIRQRAELPEALAIRAIGITSEDVGGAGLAAILGGRDANGQFDENSNVLTTVTNSAGQAVQLTNHDLFTKVNADQTLYYTGLVDAKDGIVLTGGSVTDLSGTAIFNPRTDAIRTADGSLRPLVEGRVVAGGVIETAATYADPSDPLFSNPTYGNVRYLRPGGQSGSYAAQTVGRELVALNGATIDIDGARATFDAIGSGLSYIQQSEWTNAGRISALAGGSLAGASISAQGGAAAAEGGILEWLNPTLRQSGTGERTANVLYANDIMNAGFDTMLVRGGFGVEGALNLALDKSFILASAPANAPVPTEASLAVTTVVGAGADARIIAPYIRLSSTAPHASDLLARRAAQSGGGTLSFDARTIDLVGGLGFIVPTGTTGVAGSAGSVSFNARDAIRLTGVSPVITAQNAAAQTGLSGQVISTGDMLFNAAQIYATTGTGSLQQRIADQAAGKAPTNEAFTIGSTHSNGTIRFARASGTTTPTAPLSAGTHLRILAANIAQDGVLRAPFGLIEFGSGTSQAIRLAGQGASAPATRTLSFGAGSLTSVSGAGLNVPYGTTTDLTEYFFAPATNAAITVAPSGELSFSGAAIDFAAGSTVDGTGGGDLFSFEFIPGTGGSRDVLDRFNPDAASGNDGLQYADGRQVFAIIPVDQAEHIARFDPIYSADYAGGGGIDLYGLNAGRTIVLDAAPGIAAGEYLLLPAHYALLPGAMRVVENVDLSAPVPGNGEKLLDGSIIVGGTYATKGTGFAESTRRSFTVQDQATFLKSSRIETRSATQTVKTQAEKAGNPVPRSPLDAARVVLSPLTSLKVAGVFATDAAKDGRGSAIDITGAGIRIVSDLTAATATAPAGTLLLSTGSLTNLNGNSYAIGGRRSDNADGTTALAVTARTVTVDGDVSFAAPELLFAVAGDASALTIRDGARLGATGTLDDTRASDYVVSSVVSSSDTAAVGSIVRLSSGAERLFTRVGESNEFATSGLSIGAATLTANAVALDTTGSFALANGIVLDTANLGISGSSLKFDYRDGALNAPVLETIGKIAHVTLRSTNTIGFNPGTYAFRNLKIDAPAVSLIVPKFAETFDLVFNAENVEITNSAKDLGGCKGAFTFSCGDFFSAFTLNAQEVTLGNGTFRTYGFDAGVTINAAKGVYIAGTGGFLTENYDDPRFGTFTINTPFIADRGTAEDPRVAATRPDYTFYTAGDFVVNGTGSTLAPTGFSAPGGRLQIGTSVGSTYIPVQSVRINDALIRMTAGIIDIKSDADITLAGTARLAVPGYSRSFGEAADKVTVSAGGGTVALRSINGSLFGADTSSIVTDSGVGGAGTLSLIAARGAIDVRSTLNPSVAAGTLRTGSFQFDSGLSGFDFAKFVSRYGSQFGGDISIYTRFETGIDGADPTVDGDLRLNAGQVLRARSISLTAENGAVIIDGTLNTSGDNVRTLALTDAAYTSATVNGGNVSLFGGNGLTLGSTARITTATFGYADKDTRTASAGDVMLGIGTANDATLTIASGAVIDAGAARTADRYVADTAKDATTGLQYATQRYVAGDTGGTVTLRAPVIGANDALVDIVQRGTITGAFETVVEGYKRFDLDSIASRGTFSGLSYDGDSNILYLNPADTGTKPNFFADTTTAGTLPSFVRTFAIGAENGDSLNGYRVRPGIELVSGGRISLESNWNLGAGVITDYAGAVADGLMRVSPLGAYTSGPLAGQQRYEVVAGKEAELFSRYVNMVYRTNGGAITGEAPIVTIRARGDLTIKNSISDGFFAFHDRTDADYISYQLGGGNRTVTPAVRLSCGSATSGCVTTTLYDASLRNNGSSGYMQLNLTNPLAGTDLQRYVHSPYNPLGNGVGGTGSGDPFGVAELFPLLDGDATVRSSDLRLVGGAGDPSVNPLHVDFSLNNEVVVTGEDTYQIAAKAGKIGFGGSSVQVEFDPADAEFETTLFTPGDVIGTLNEYLENFGDDASSSDSSDFAVRFNFRDDGTALTRKVREAALSFFAGGNFVRSGGVATAVIAPLGQVMAFLNGQFGAEYVAAAAATYNATGAPGIKQNVLSFSQESAYVGTIVRTGDGSISIAASRDIDLSSRAGFAVDRDENGKSRNAGVSSSNAQVGGTAVYTAGVRAGASATAGTRVWDAERIDYIPTTRGALATTPVLAQGGGDIVLAAGGSVLGRRDVWAERYLGTAPSDYSNNALDVIGDFNQLYDPLRIGGFDQRWRVGTVGQDTEIAIVPQLFTAGVGALAGGDIHITAANQVNDLTIALDSSVTTRVQDGTPTLFSYGTGNLLLTARGDLLGGAIDVASGVADVTVGGSVGSSGAIITDGAFLTDTSNLLRVRVANATLDLSAMGTIDIAGIGALGATVAGSDVQSIGRDNANGFFTAIAGASLLANGSVAIVRNRPELVSNFNYVSATGGMAATTGIVLAPSLSLTSLGGTAGFGAFRAGEDFPVLAMLYPSAIGQLRILAADDIGNFALAMSDADPTDLPGAFTGSNVAYNSGRVTVNSGLGYTFPGLFPNTTEARRRMLHNPNFVSTRDSNPVQILTDGSFSNAVLSLPKAARIGAGVDIANLYFDGQNVRASDTTRITAGRDITGTTEVTGTDNATIAGRPYVSGNSFVLGGPGALFVEAGRDLGPFLTSAEVKVGAPADTVLSFTGGIRTIGNEANPWLAAQGADLYTFFGVGNGADYAALRETYLNPANFAALDGDLFVQVADALGNLSPDRSRQVYAPVLAQWLQENAPDAFAAAFGDVPASDADYTARAYARVGELYTALTTLDELSQRRFLLDKVYFGEIAAASDPNGPSFNQPIRGYRAIEALFPARLGYTDNLATFTTDPSTIDADHPLGVPRKKLVDGQPMVADTVVTGNVDLRLATLQTARGGDISIIGPGGNFIAGSLVRTSAQIARKATGFGRELENGKFINAGSSEILSIPLGSEGVLTLRGGAVRTFTDGNFQLNQSRLFTLGGGDITMWSSNGDLNAGQGPKNASNFPPITLRFNLNGLGEIDSAGSVSGAGIGAFKPTPTSPESRIVLLAPVGTVDAGDAGVRASGSVFVAAARVANADNFAAGGGVSGIPSLAAVSTPVAPTSASSAVVANAFRAGNKASDAADRLSRVIVDILGYFGGGRSQDDCPDGQERDDQGRCR